MRRIIFGWGAFFVLFAGVGLTAAHVASAEDFTSANYQVLAPVITSGGGYASSDSDSYSLLGVISEFAHDLSSITSFGLVPGFAAFPYVSTPVVIATAGNASASLSWTAAVGVLGYSISGYSIGYSSNTGGPYTFTTSDKTSPSSVSKDCKWPS